MNSPCMIVVATLIGAVLVSQGCQSSPPPVFPGISGTQLSQGADIQANEQTAQAIVALFKHAEEAVQRRDLEALMMFYSGNYSHGGYTKGSVRAV